MTFDLIRDLHHEDIQTWIYVPPVEVNGLFHQIVIDPLLYQVNGMIP